MSTSPKWIIMQVDNILIGIVSIAGIVFTYWFFLMKKEEKLRRPLFIEETGYRQEEW